MKIAAIEVTDASIPVIEEYCLDINPIALERFRSEGNYYLIVTQREGELFEALCYIEQDGFATEFNAGEPLKDNWFTTVTEL